MYIATVSYDFNSSKSGHDNNQQMRLGKALEHLGWDYADTSAFTIETEEYSDVSKTFELLVRSVEAIGELSALASIFRESHVST